MLLVSEKLSVLKPAIILTSLIPAFLFLHSDSSCENSNILRIACAQEPLETGLIYTINSPFEFRWNAFLKVEKMDIDEIYDAVNKQNIDFVLINDVDIVDRLVKENKAKNKEPVMSNLIVLFGPDNDPCRIAKSNDIEAAFRIIKGCKQLFYSSYKDSGIDRIEKSIWNAVGGFPHDVRTLKTGFGATLKLLEADKNHAYCLIDAGTYYENLGRISGRLFCTEDRRYKNEYFGCVVTEDPGGNQNYVLAMAYLGWLTSSEVQKIIENFKKNDKSLFSPYKKSEIGKDTEIKRYLKH